MCVWIYGNLASDHTHTRRCIFLSLLISNTRGSSAFGAPSSYFELRLSPHLNANQVAHTCKPSSKNIRIKGKMGEK